MARLEFSRTAATAGFIAILIGLLFAVSPFDLPLSIAVFNPDSRWARWIAGFGTLPTSVLYVAALVFMLAAVPRGSPFRKHPLTMKSATALLMMGILQPFAITAVMKALFGRPRFVQLQGHYALFTHFYQSSDLLQGASFPSGHVATATVMFPIAWVLWREGRRPAGATVFALTAAWGIITAAGRIVAGAHYLTDTVFSFGLAIVLSPLVGDAARALWQIAHGRLDGPEKSKITPSA